MLQREPSKEYIDYICGLYDDYYDDRIEDSKPPAAGDDKRDPGEDWITGMEANHKSLMAFQRQLKDMGIKLSTSKIRKILITGGCWTTERSREIAELYGKYTRPVSDGGKGLSGDVAIRQIAADLEVSLVTVSVNLPYQEVVYNLANRSSNAVRCAKYKARMKEKKSKK